MPLARYVPSVQWLRSYRRSDLPGDLLAAGIVTIMLIPQSLAYAMLAGVPPQVGLYASVLPLVAYAAFGSSRTLAVGPVAVVSLMTASAIGEFAGSGTAQYAAAALLLAFLSGLFLLGLGLMRLGFLANLLSHPVISGFISASAIVIALSQLKHVLGIEASGDNLVSLLGGIGSHARDANWTTIVIGLGSLLFLLWTSTSLSRVLRRWGLPASAADLASKAAPVAAVAIATGAVAALALHEVQGVKIVGAIPAGLPPFTLPGTEWRLWLDLAPAAALIGLVGFVESVSVAHALAAKRRQKIDPDQELVGLGAANMAAAFSGGFPVTGGFARSVVNVAAGANTQLAAVFTALLIAVAAAWLTPVFYFMPHAVLAATIIVAVLRLVDLRTLAHAWKYDRADAVALMATAITVLVIGVEAGILVGIAVSLTAYLWRTSRPHLAIVGQVPGTEHYRNVLRHRVLTRPEILAVRVDESLYFVNARFLENRVATLVAEHPDARHVVLICSAVNLIDASALETLAVINENLMASGVQLHLAEVKGPVMDRLAKVGFLDRLSGEVFLSTHAAMQALSIKEDHR